MDQLIPIASKLQDVLGALGQTTALDLPQIVVVGGQSSGKSSVLESLVGRSFLPRGTGIVTRRPLILQLYNTMMMVNPDGSGGGGGGGTGNSNSNGESDDDDGDDSDDDLSTMDPAAAAVAVHTNNNNANTNNGPEWGEFLHLPGKKMYDFDDIRNEIVAETERSTGGNGSGSRRSNNSKSIDPTPIHLKIYSPRVLALTLVDLPGMAKVPVGDQPADIEKQIYEMLMTYISNPNAIILAVTAANTDLANSDALKLAQTADPNGNRTVGVLTKVDLMDPGTHCLDILRNEVIPLRRGYIAVVNRGQQDIHDNRSIRDGLAKELAFFKGHPAYSRDRHLLETKCGTSQLAKTMNAMLMHHIRDVLPDLKTRISHMQNDVEQELVALGAPFLADNSRTSRGAAMLRLLSKFATSFGSLLEGRGTDEQQYGCAASGGNNIMAGGSGGGATSSLSRTQQNLPVNELMGGARISYIFTEVFAASLLSVGPFDSLNDDEIRTTICNANGIRPALLFPEISFDILVRRQIARLEQPGIQCVDLVYDELQRIALQAEPVELTRFPVLRDRINEVVATLLRKCVNPTQHMVANLVKIELAYINTSHPDFIGGSRAVARLMDKFGEGHENEVPRNFPPPIHDNDDVDDDDDNHVGATPLSSSSLNNYGYEDAHESARDLMAAHQSPKRNNDAAKKNSGNTKNHVGIMNLLAQGGGNNNSKTTTAAAKNKKKNATNGRRQSSTTKQGPPTIVHLPQVPDRMNQTDVAPTHKERVEVEVIKTLIESYFNIVLKTFIDQVPKMIMYFLVNHVRESIQNELVSELYNARESEMANLMQEADDIAVRRQTCSEMKDLLGKAMEIVNEVRDFNTFEHV